MTMFSALLFSFPPDETDGKSFVRNVPIPNEPGKDQNSESSRMKEIVEQTSKPELVALLFDLKRLLVRQCIRVYDRPFPMVCSDGVEAFLCSRCKGEWITRVLTKTCPAICPGGVSSEVLKRVLVLV